jgi:hypothetical protein
MNLADEFHAECPESGGDNNNNYYTKIHRETNSD